MLRLAGECLLILPTDLLLEFHIQVVRKIKRDVKSTLDNRPVLEFPNLLCRKDVGSYDRVLAGNTWIPVSGEEEGGELVSEPVRIAGAGGHQEGSGDRVGDDGEKEGDRVTRLVLALSAGQVGKQLGVRVMAGEHESPGDVQDGLVGVARVQLGQTDEEIGIVLTRINLQIIQDLVGAHQEVVRTGDVLVRVGDEGGEDTGPHYSVTLETGNAREGQQLGHTHPDTVIAQVRVG